jgi:hypothetical protein
MNKGRLYPIIGIANFAGIGWLIYHFKEINNLESNPVCPIKLTSGYPCPSCGSTRSILAILHGDFIEALLLNPLGYLSFVLIGVTSILMLIDWLKKTDLLLRFYLFSENKLKQKAISIPFIILILLNWIWNITKGL